MLIYQGVRFSGEKKQGADLNPSIIRPEPAVVSMSIYPG
ncbi:MAG: hypothetical protein CENE_02600 [Candidatus Celerinatantimonas neptuna]|nr:MAG: hypothetical protein CENE_02600 [Candidatus Celerinatantimonas neptuna]